MEKTDKTCFQQLKINEKFHFLTKDGVPAGRARFAAEKV
jgi:hypothetical protein